MEPYVVHWIEGWEHERRCHDTEGPCKVDYIYFLPRPQPNAVPAKDSDRWSNIGVEVHTHVGAGKIFRLDLERAMRGFTSPVSHFLGWVSTSLEHGLFHVRGEIAPKTTLPEGGEESPNLSTPHDPPQRPSSPEGFRDIKENMRIYSPPPVSPKTIRITAKVRLPSPTVRGLPELFDEPDLRRFILRRKLDR